MPSRPITDEQYEKLLTEVSREKVSSFVKKRDVLYYKMLWFLGLRPGECRLIKVSQINFVDKTIFIPAQNNKERHEDYIFVPEFLFEKIIEYLRTRKVKSEWVFPNYHKRSDPVGTRTTQRAFTNRMKKLGFIHLSYYDKANVPRYNLNLYSFRKHFETFVYVKMQRDPKITANLLRHRDPALKSVWRYIFWAEDSERKNLMQELYA